MAFVSATKHLHYAGRFLSLQKDLSSAPAISERRGRRHIKYTLRHSQFVRYIISGKENAIDTPWQTNEQLQEH